jgi:LPXTG-site transpeptidase (sortase) family protein
MEPGITRLDAVVKIVDDLPRSGERLAALRAHLPPLPLFRDTSQDQWYAPYLEVAFEEGIVAGYPDSTFHPEEQLRSEEAVAMIARAFSPKNAEAMHGDNWVNASVQMFVQAGLTSSLPSGLGRAITASEFASLLPHLQRRAQVLAFGEEHEQVEPTATPTEEPLPVDPASVSFSLDIPTLDIANLPVIHPTDPFTSDGIIEPLHNGVGHLFSYPGQGGTIMIYGHSSGYPWDLSEYTRIFRTINRMSIDDLVYVHYGDTVHTYRVTAKRTIPARDTSTFANDGTDRERLILYTCWPPDTIMERYIVVAEPV